MKEKFLLGLKLLLIVLLVVVGSIISVKIWSGKEEIVEAPTDIIIDENMTIAQIGKVNKLSNIVLKNAFQLHSKEDLQKKFSETGLSIEDAKKKIVKSFALPSEEASKNWKKIAVKFVLWIAFLVFIFTLIRKNKIKTKLRNRLYFIAFVLFGIVLGADPSPMGTIKDNISLLGSYHVIFPPRVVALFVMLLMVVLANKFICSWGCQFGTLQDFIFRMNRKNKKPIIKQIKLPFVMTNAIRILFFVIFTFIAILWAFDIIAPIDPFKIFKPATLGIIGIIFVAIMLSVSLIIYRPWCHLFCPFGLIGWVAEKISIIKIKVDYDKCIACGNCMKSCPSTAMEAIIKHKKTTPDCFSCATCIESCPVDAISFRGGKRNKPSNEFIRKLNKNLK